MKFYVVFQDIVLKIFLGNELTFPERINTNEQKAQENMFHITNNQGN